MDKTLYISGQIGMDVNSGQLMNGIEAQTKMALDHIGHILEAAGASYKNGIRVFDNSVFCNEKYLEF